MNCNERQGLTPDFLASDLEPAQEADFRAHLVTCEACRTEVEDLLELWSRLGLLPEEAPSPTLRAGFYARLEAYRAGQADRVQPFARLRPLWKGAAAAGLLVAGTLVGLRLQHPVEPPPQAISNQEVEALRHQATVGLLARPEAGDRLKGLALVSQVKRPDAALLGTLLDTLDKDDSVNVRLAAVDALFLFADAPGVRERLLTAVQKEPSPLVQAALIDLLVGLREKRAADALKRLSVDPGARPEVRQRAQQGLQTLL